MLIDDNTRRNEGYSADLFVKLGLERVAMFEQCFTWIPDVFIPICPWKIEQDSKN